MPVVTGQVSVGTAPVQLFIMPPGPCDVIVSNAGTVTAYYAAGGSATPSNGVPLPTGASQRWTGYQGPGIPFTASTNGATATVGWLVSSPSGATGL